tara:strand:+ start:355 stop:648 length:294 start_codon:yes stop_codon:yes gene_type:complete
MAEIKMIVFSAMHHELGPSRQNACSMLRSGNDGNQACATSQTGFRRHQRSSTVAPLSSNDYDMSEVSFMGGWLSAGKPALHGIDINSFDAGDWRLRM